MDIVIQVTSNVMRLHVMVVIAHLTVQVTVVVLLQKTVMVTAVAQLLMMIVVNAVVMVHHAHVMI